MEEQDLALIDITSLPSSLQELVQLIGMVNAYRMSRAFGGCAKYIPKYPHRSSLRKILDEDALNKMAERFAGTTLEISKVDSFIRQIRNQKICEDVKFGKSRSCIAGKYGLSIRHIENIINNNKHNHILHGE